MPADVHRPECHLHVYCEGVCSANRDCEIY